MRVDVKDITRIKPGAGYVLVEVPYLVKDEKDNGLNLVATETVGDYVVRSGVVVAYSEETEVPGTNMMFQAPVQVKVGEKVWWIPNASQHIATSDDHGHKVIRAGERTFVLIPHKRLVMKLHGGEYVGLNDYVITEPVELTDKAFDMSAVENKGQFHRVVAAPACPVYYEPSSHSQDFSVPLVPGSTILLRVPRMSFIEHEHNKELPGRWCAFQSRYVLAHDTTQVSTAAR